MFCVKLHHVYKIGDLIRIHQVGQWMGAWNDKTVIQRNIQMIRETR